MPNLRITVGDLRFVGALEAAKAPRTCALFLELLPLRTQMIHACWSGEAGVILLDQPFPGLPLEHATNHPARGDLLLYPGGFSEPKILFPYGSAQFISKVGPLAGAHFITLVEGRELLDEIDRLLLWQGAQPTLFELLG